MASRSDTRCVSGRSLRSVSGESLGLVKWKIAARCGRILKNTGYAIVPFNYLACMS